MTPARVLGVALHTQVVGRGVEYDPHDEGGRGGFARRDPRFGPGVPQRGQDGHPLAIPRARAYEGQFCACCELDLRAAATYHTVATRASGPAIGKRSRSADAAIFSIKAKSCCRAVQLSCSPTIVWPSCISARNIDCKCRAAQARPRCGACACTMSTKAKVR